MSQINAFYGLETALRGLRAQQRAIDVAGHNIANASTVGYSRQEALLQASDAHVIQGPGAQQHLGAGVEVGSYRRVRDTFLDLQYRSQVVRLGEHEARSENLDRAELALAEPGENGIATQLARLWNGWADVVNAPDDPAARQALVEQAASLAGAFRTVDSQIQMVQEQAAEEYASLVGPYGEIDGIVREVASLNTTISSFTITGDSPNDLYDRRDILLDKLAKLGNTSVEQLSDGLIRVRFGGAANPIVDGTTSSWPQAISDGTGRLGALGDAASPTGTLGTYRAQLGSIAATLATSINTLHRTGSGGTGKDFFTFDPADPGGTIAVGVTAAEVQTTTQAPGVANGDNALALAIGALRGGQTDKDYRAFISRLGSEVRESKRQEANASVLATAVDDRRQATSGVALDEEMTNLVRFQRAYQASARAMSTMDEMLDVLINRTGRVGL